MILKGLDDKSRSEEMLKAYNNDISFASLAKKSLPLFVIRLLVVGFCVWMYMDNHEMGALFLFGGGVLLGALAQDLGWLARISNSWDFTKRTTDWEKVKTLSKDDKEKDSEEKS